jgi:transposase
LPYAEMETQMNPNPHPSPHQPPVSPLIPNQRRPHLFHIPPERPILGVDVSKERLHVTFDARSGKLRETACPNTPAGIQRLLKTTPPHCCWVLEPTGRYGDAAVDLARAAGREVLMADPRRAKAFMRSGPERAKNDPLDGRGLTEYAATRPLPRYPRPTPVTERTRQLLSARKGLSQSVSRLNQQRSQLKLAAAALEPACLALQAQIKSIDVELAQLVQDPAHAEEVGAAPRLDAVPGVGPVTATAAAACLHTRNFGHPDQFIAYLGMDVTVRESGKSKGKKQISSQGDAELRRLFYLAAQANLRVKQSPFRTQYERERAKGLPHTGAVCAVARKLAKVCWSLVKHGGKYDPERVYVQPKPKKTTDPDGNLQTSS